MKSYLDLVPIAAKVRRRQNRMSVACIILAVFLVTTIFGMADMYIRAQIIQLEQDAGNFHIAVLDITDEEAALITERPEVAAASRYGVMPYEASAPYTLYGHSVIVCGCDAAMMTDILNDAIVEGRFPETTQEVMLTENARDVYGAALGDKVTITTPTGGSLQYTVSGFCSDSAQTMSSDGLGAFLNTAAFRQAYADAKGVDAEHLENVNLDAVNSGYYVQFEHPFLAQHSIAALKEDLQLDDDQVIENVKLLGLYGQSSSSQLMQIYMAAVVLGALVLVAGVLMIASSLNANVAQRTAFYGMLRCLGASPKQVMKLVRREALRWCRFAIPCGVLIGVVLIWLLCALLRHLSPGYFATMPVFAVSVPSIAAGIVLGFLTVLFAARSPAKRAARVSPLTAVSGSASDQAPARGVADTRHFRVETALGIHHAKASRKNLLLMVSSFAFSIILFLSFSVAVDMTHTALTPLKPWTADVSITSKDNGCSLSPDLVDEIADMEDVKNVFGRMAAYQLPADDQGQQGSVDVISYEDEQFAWAEAYLLEGDVETAETQKNAVLAVYEPLHPFEVGDILTLTADGRQQQVEIVGLLSQAPYASNSDFGALVCSEATFQTLTDARGYSVIDVQLAAGASDASVNAIRSLAGDDVSFADDRLGNDSARGTYCCFCIFVYGFLVIIALITIFNIINSIAMSVAARTQQYGVFRALGLSNRQLKKMIVAEAATYTILGGLLGTVLGLVANWVLSRSMLTSIFGIAWTPPWQELATILIVMLLSVIVAVRKPVRRIQSQAIVETLHPE